MNSQKHHLIVGCLVLISFLWGYKRGSIEAALGSLISSLTSDEPESAPTPPAAAPAAQLSPTRPVTPDPFGNSYRKLGAATGGVNPEGPAANQAPGTPPSPFAGNLDSIKQNKIQEGQTLQRNAYFDKLSQQMKELRGSPSIPEPRPAPNSDAPPSPVPDAPPPPPTPSPADRIERQRAGSPAIEVPGVTGSHPEFSAGDEEDEEEVDDADEELDNLEDELAEIDADSDE